MAEKGRGWQKRLVFQTVVGLALFGWWWFSLDRQLWREVWGRIGLGWVGLAVGVYLLAGFLRGLRFKLILGRLAQFGVWEVFAVDVVGTLVNFLVPIRLGELMKPLLLKKRRTGVSGTRVMAAVLLDKLGDLISMLLTVFLILPFCWGWWGHEWFFVWGGLLLAGAGGGGYLLLWQGERLLKGQWWLRQRRWLGWVPKWFWGYGENFLKAFAFYQSSPGILVATLIFSLVETVLDGVAFWLVLSALGFEVFILRAVLGLTLVYFTFLLPAAPGYVGTMEVGGTLLLVVGTGLGRQTAAVAVAFYHLLSASVLFLNSWWAISYLGIGGWFEAEMKKLWGLREIKRD